MFSEGGKLVFVPDFGNEHDCPRPLHLLELRAESFAKQPLDPIALHALAVPFSHRDAHAREGIQIIVREGENARLPFEKSF